MVAGWRLALAATAITLCSAEPSDQPHYTNHFAVEVPGGRHRAERAAKEHHCSVIDTVRGDVSVVRVTSHVGSNVFFSTRADRGCRDPHPEPTVQSDHTADLGHAS